jgi:hypothetical protein
MKGILDAQMNNWLCEQALSELYAEGCNMSSWLFKYQALFEEVTVKPEGLPRITMVYVDVIYFENISLFASAYEKREQFINR